MTQRPAPVDRIRLGLFTGATPHAWDVPANARRFEETLAAHAGQNIDLVVTPECFLDGYAASAPDWTPERFAEVAQEIETSPTLVRLRTQAARHRMALLLGFTEREGDSFFNTALWIARDGALAGRYRKTHLQKHDLRFCPGGTLPVFETPWGKAGVLICADRRWPESARVLRLRGARLTLVPSYGMWGPDNEGWMRTRAYENENFLAFVHPQVAFVADPRGQILAKLQTNVPDLLVCDLDLAAASETAHLRDRRPELYAEITRPKAEITRPKEEQER